jgi:hypothetical protein
LCFFFFGSYLAISDAFWIKDALRAPNYHSKVEFHSLLNHIPGFCIIDERFLVPSLSVFVPNESRDKKLPKTGFQWSIKGFLYALNHLNPKDSIQSGQGFS